MPVYVIDTLKPKNGLDFPVVEAVDVAVEGYSSLADAVTHFATDTAIAAINAALDTKADKTTTDDLQAQIDQIVISASAESVVAPEVAQARVDEYGTEFSTLGNRIDSDFSFLLNNIQAFGISDNILCERIESEGINSAGQIYNNDNFDVYFASVVPGKTIIIVTDALKYAFYDKKPAFNLISIDSTRHEFTAGEIELSVPLSARYIGIQVNKSATTIPKVYYKGSVQDQAKKANAEIAELKVSPIEGTRITDKTLPIASLSAASHYPYSNFINKDKFKPNTYVDSDGNVKPTTGFLTTDRIYLDENTTYYMYNLWLGFCAFYSSDGTVLAAYGGSSSPFTIYSGPRSIYTFTAPPETSYAIFTVNNVSKAQTAWIYTSDAQPVDFKYYIPIYAEPAYHEPSPIEDPINGNRIIDGTLATTSLSQLTHYIYTNYIDMDAVNPGTYVDSNGAIQISSEFTTTARIKLIPGTTYYMYNLWLGFCAFYSSDGTVLAAYGSSDSPFEIYDAPKSIYSFTVPAGTSYAVFSYKSGRTVWIYHEPKKPADYQAYLPIYAESAYNEPIPTEYKGYETSIFRNVLCIGDSFTQGGFNADAHDPDSGSGFQDYSYPTNLAKMVGFNVTNMGHGGETTVSWNRTYTDTIQGGYDLCIILLGINDCVNYGSFTEQSQEALGEIIAKVKAMNNHIKIFVCTIPLSPSYKTQPIIDSAQIIKDYIESLDDEDIYILDLAEYGHLDDSFAYTYGHPTAYGYHILAEDINNYICYIINKNKMDFKFIQFTGTEYTHNTPR